MCFSLVKKRQNINYKAPLPQKKTCFRVLCCEKVCFRITNDHDEGKLGRYVSKISKIFSTCPISLNKLQSGLRTPMRKYGVTVIMQLLCQSYKQFLKSTETGESVTIYHFLHKIESF